MAVQPLLSSVGKQSHRFWILEADRGESEAGESSIVGITPKDVAYQQITFHMQMKTL